MKNLKLSWKLGLGFAAVLAVLVGVLGVSFFTVRSVSQGYSSLLSTEGAIADRAATALNLMLQCRRNEKDFLLRRDPKYLAQCQKNCSALINEAESIAKLARQAGYKQVQQAAEDIKSYAQEYIIAFQKVVAGWQAKGLDEKSGLQGTFRTAAHQLEAELAKYDVDDLNVSLLQLRRREKDLAMSGDPADRVKFDSALTRFSQILEKSGSESSLKAGLQKSLADYTQAMAAYTATQTEQKDAAYQRVRATAHALETAMARVHIPDAQVIYLQIRRHEKDYLLREDEKYVKKAQQAIASLRQGISAAGVDKALANGLEKQLDAYQGAFQSLVAKNKEIKRLMETMRQVVHKVEPAAEQIAVKGGKAMSFKAENTQSSANRGSLIANLIGLAAVAMGLLLAWAIARSISMPIRRITENLTSGASQVAAAATQVSGASQSLAQGASEQAASLEETSSSMEEMSSMTKQNADNASQANSLMDEASKVVAQANASMRDLREAMEKITAASDETAKIIKTIDEIAFQTNLLALNAAVEAARAGEAGAGFAVVADEVRSLAMRAAEAAKNTNELIEGNLQNIKRGAELVTSTDQAFSQVEENSCKVGELVAEIAAASGEQAQGIEQINKAAGEMDKVTQQVAANAEESAASSEELNAQAETLNTMVGELRSMVDGAGKKGPQRIKAGKVRKTKYLPGPGDSQRGESRSAGQDSNAYKTRATREIPLDEDRDFADF